MIRAIDTEHAWAWVLAAGECARRHDGSEPLVVQDPQGRHPALTVAGEGVWQLPVACEPEARALFDRLLPLCAPGTHRLVIGQMGQTLDGRVTTRKGLQQVINGPDGLLHLHRLRALVDAVVVGRGTAECDDPQLTVRHAPGQNPTRVILDPGGRLPASKAVFARADAATLHLVAKDAEPISTRAHVTTVRLPITAAEPCAPQTILAALSGRGLNRVLIEGGGHTVSQFLDADALTHLHVLVAPVILGTGVAGFSLPETAAWPDVRRHECHVHALGSDTLFAMELA